MGAGAKKRRDVIRDANFAGAMISTARTIYARAIKIDDESTSAARLTKTRGHAYNNVYTM